MRPILAIALLALPTVLAAQPVARTVPLKLAGGADAGTATLTPAPKGVMIRIEAKGLTPGWHGIHLHSVGDCSDGAAGFKKSGGHVHSGTASIHGLLNPQADDTGDLPNIHADADGRAYADLFTPLVTMDTLADQDGAAVIIHASPDDYKTQPIGGAGNRVACGVIR